MATPQIPEKHRGDPALGQAAAALIWPTRQASPGGGLVVGSVQWSCSSLPHPAIPSYQAANHQPQKIPPRLSFCLGRGLLPGESGSASRRFAASRSRWSWRRCAGRTKSPSSARCVETCRRNSKCWTIIPKHDPWDCHRTAHQLGAREFNIGMYIPYMGVFGCVWDTWGELNRKLK